MSSARIVALGAAALLSSAAVATPFIVEQEGMVFNGYVDLVGKPTACGGSTADVIVGRKYTEAECLSRLFGDVVSHTGEMAACIKVPVHTIPQESLAAFISFTYNVGTPKFCSSTLLKKLNAGDVRGACAQLSRWDKGWVVGELKPRPIRGLTTRRAKERALCEAGLT